MHIDWFYVHYELKTFYLLSSLRIGGRLEENSFIRSYLRRVIYDRQQIIFDGWSRWHCNFKLAISWCHGYLLIERGSHVPFSQCATRWYSLRLHILINNIQWSKIFRSLFSCNNLRRSITAMKIISLFMMVNLWSLFDHRILKIRIGTINSWIPFSVLRNGRSICLH